MVLNFEIWSVVIGLMELGCAMTWNHDEQFVEGDFPYYPYTNRIYGYADTSDGLTDARIRSNEFSGFKMAPNRKRYEEKRKPLYAFNKDSSKLIDATKISEEPEIFESSRSEKLKPPRHRPNYAEVRNLGSDVSKKLNSTEQELKTAKFKKLEPAEQEMLNSGDSENFANKLTGAAKVGSGKAERDSAQSNKPNSVELEEDNRNSDSGVLEKMVEHKPKPSKSKKVEPASPVKLNGAEKSEKKLKGATKVDADEAEKLESAQSKQLSAKVERVNSAKARNLGSDVPQKLSSAEKKLQKSSKSEKLSIAGPVKLNADKSEKLGKKLTEASKPDSNHEAEKLESAHSKKLSSARLISPNFAEGAGLDARQTLNSGKQCTKSARPEKLRPVGRGKPGKDLVSRNKKQKLKTKIFFRNYKKAAAVKKGQTRAPGQLRFGGKRLRRNSELESNISRRSSSIGESDSPGRYLWAHGIPNNFGPWVSNPKSKSARDDKPNDKNRKLTLVAPYETNFSASGVRSVNPSSWLAKEIERFIRRKDHRWLDFMKNTGMDVKKYSGVVSTTKRKSDINPKKTSCVGCLHPSTAPGLDDPAKLKTDLLIMRIDALLADLNQFRSSVKTGWSDFNSLKKTRDSETSQKLTNDDLRDKRKHRSRRGIRFGRFSAFTRPPAQSSTSGMVENDLRDLRKNVVLYKNRLPEEEMQALEDMKLHIKVYVEKDHRKEDHHASCNEMQCDE